jgi:hypothetical protein
MALGSDTQALTTTAAALNAHPCTEASVHNNDAAINVLVGNAAAQNYTLGPGQTVRLRVKNTNQIYAKSASGTPTLSMIWV